MTIPTKIRCFFVIYAIEDITSIVSDWTIYQVEGGIVSSVQFAARAAQKMYLVKIFEVLEKLLILLPLELANGHLNTKTMHKEPKYFLSSFASLATSCGGALNFALNAIEVSAARLKNLQKHIGHVGYAPDNTIVLAWDKSDLFAQHAKKEL